MKFGVNKCKVIDTHREKPMHKYPHKDKFREKKPEKNTECLENITVPWCKMLAFHIVNT